MGKENDWVRVMLHYVGCFPERCDVNGEGSLVDVTKWAAFTTFSFPEEGKPLVQRKTLQKH